MVTAKRLWHPAVTAVVFVMAIGSAVNGNDLGATLFLLAVALVNAALLLLQHRHGRSRRT